MSTPVPEPVQLPVADLAAYYGALAGALQRAGLKAHELNHVLGQCVRAECVQCGIQVSGQELGVLHLGGTGTDPADQRLERLAKGYCARRDCASYYYRLVVEAHPGVDWAAVLPRVQDAQAEPAAPRAAAAPARTWRWWRDPRVLRVAAGLAIVLLLLVVKYLKAGGTIPLLHKDPGYKIDPSSLNQPASKQ